MGKLTMYTTSFLAIIAMSIRADTATLIAAPPGCLKLCASGKLGDQQTCLKRCPSFHDCQEALHIPAALRKERYTPSLSFVSPPRPMLCVTHCREGNVFTEEACMLDCPKTWCQRFGGMSSVKLVQRVPTKQFAEEPPCQTTVASGTPSNQHCQCTLTKMYVAFISLGISVVTMSLVTTICAYRRIKQQQKLIHRQETASGMPSILKCTFAMPAQPVLKWKLPSYVEPNEDASVMPMLVQGSLLSEPSAPPYDGHHLNGIPTLNKPM